MEVHKILGVGFLESVYEEALALEFQIRKIPFQKQKNINVVYKGKIAKQFVCDFLVFDKIIVELKAIKAISEVEKAQLINYLKASKLDLGLTLNFGSKSLEIKRVINTH